MQLTVTRRQFIKTVGGAVVGAAVLSGIGGLLSSCAKKEKPLPPLPWPYVKLDPEYVRKLGHLGYYKGACSAGSFYAILWALREKVGYPYTILPLEPPHNMLHYGEGGVIGWGALCGALNGSCAAINLVSKDYKAIINELLGWYTETPFPSEISNRYAVEHAFPAYKEKIFSDKALPTSVAHAIQCHISVSRWCAATGYAAESDERKERCARLVGDVAAKAVELLNAVVDGVFKPVWTVPETVTKCMTCHREVIGTVPNVRAGVKMNCELCHGKPHG